MGATWEQKHARRSGDDRFGYRPGLERRKSKALFTHQIGQDERRQYLDKIHFDQLKRQWQAANAAKGRENWHDFGNTDLPVEAYRDDIMKMLATSRVSLLAGETGSGKSTQLAQYALEMGYDHIVYLQPRRVTTDGISERVEEELEQQFIARDMHKPSNLVGMAHSDHATLRDDSVIQVMTSAVFKKRAPALETEWKDKKILIVADEVHEGNIETEFAVATAAELMTEHVSWNMVLMSATLNEEEIQEAYTPINGKPIPRVKVEGRPHEISYKECPEVDVVEVYDRECAGANKTLIFTDGKRSIGAITNELQRRHPQANILHLHSKISEQERRNIFHSADDATTQTIIISTSAGQSGITIPGVDRVISDGWTKSPELDAENASGLPRRRCSQAELMQQMGRGGRDIGGAKFFLAQPLPVQRQMKRSKGADEFVRFEDRPEHIPPDIYHTVITRNVLSAAAMDRDFYTLNEYLIHKVTKATIDEAYTVLKLFGAVDETNAVTDIGREMDRYPLRPELARALVECSKNGTKVQMCQLAAIAASIEAGGLESHDPRKRDVLRKRLSTDTDDDLLAQLDYFMGTMKHLDIDRKEGSFVVSYRDSSGKIVTEQLTDINPLFVKDEEILKAGFDVKNVIRAHKQYKKICRIMGLEEDDIYASLDNTLTSDQRTELHGLLLTGMPHLLYQEVGRKKWRGRRKKDTDGSKKTPLPTVWYRNVIGPPKDAPYEFDRKISNRSALARLAIGKTEIIAGYPRWYYDDEEELNNVIERGFRTTKSAVRKAIGRAALSIKDEVIIAPDGRLRKVSTSSIGQLRTTKEIKDTKATTEQRVDLLTITALDKPGPAQRELRSLKRALTDIAERIPVQQAGYYFERPPLSQGDLEKIVSLAAQGAASLGELDANLRQYMLENDISIHSFIHQEQLGAVEENMPVTIDIAGWTYDIKYRGAEATPYINDFPVQQASSLPNKLTIRDGREVLFRYHYDESDYRYLTARDVKAMGK